MRLHLCVDHPSYAVQGPLLVLNVCMYVCCGFSYGIRWSPRWRSAPFHSYPLRRNCFGVTLHWLRVGVNTRTRKIDCSSPTRRCWLDEFAFFWELLLATGMWTKLGMVCGWLRAPCPAVGLLRHFGWRNNGENGAKYVGMGQRGGEQTKKRFRKDWTVSPVRTQSTWRWVNQRASCLPSWAS